MENLGLIVPLPQFWMFLKRLTGFMLKGSMKYHSRFILSELRNRLKMMVPPFTVIL